VNDHSNPPSTPSKVQQLEGFMVLGIVSVQGETQARSVPVLGASAQAALSLAAQSHPGFQPVGVLSEEELQGHLNAIRAHRQQVNGSGT
jgi:hypothetical protein